jgi:hypothetical protein
MTLDYTKVWTCLNELDTVTSKICSAREVLECAIDAHENHKRDKAEALMYATDEYLQYYLKEFDEKFKSAWNEIVVKLHNEDKKFGCDTFRTPPVEPKLTCDKNDQSEECKSSWVSFWEENYYPEDRISNFPGEQYTEEELNAMCDEAEKQETDKVKRWVLPVEIDGGSGEYFLQLPDDLLDQVKWKENDTLSWENNKDGTFTLRKVTKPLEMDEC